MKKMSILIFLLGCVLSVGAQDLFLTSVPANVSIGDPFEGDYRIIPSAANASASQSGEGIERTYDKNTSTLWHSPWSKTSFPVKLTYVFKNEAQMNYIVYTPRSSDSGSNGNFKQFELWYSLTGDNKPLIKYGDFDFQGNSLPSTITFSNPLLKPDTIQFVVKSGQNDYASCAEMEFYRVRESGFDYYSSYFKDKTCSELKPGLSLNAINNIPNAVFKKLALDIYNGVYDAEFRVQEYKAYQDPIVMAVKNKTAKYGLRDNPTGIYVAQGEDLIVMVGATNGSAPSLFVQKPTETIAGTAYSLHEGANSIKVAHAGLVYILYYTSAGTEAPVKINIVTGKVNGYYDKNKHTNAGDWARLLAKATYTLFDVKGDYATLNFETAAYRKYVPDGKALIDRYDDLVWQEQDFLGLFKYNKAFKNRAHFQVMYGDGYMNASDYRTAYHTGTQENILNLTKLLEKSPLGPAWGPAHELGHVHQTRPGLDWLGMAEVTNNIHSQYVTTTWGIPSRLQYENLGNGKNRYDVAIAGIVDAKITYIQHSDVFCRLVPFWQIKLYMHNVKGNNDFYKDIYEKVRVNPDPVAQNGSSRDGMCQLEFVRLVCEVSHLDFTEFFEKWGFLKAINVSIDDYGVGQFIVTQASIDDIKAKIAAMKYPKVPADLYKINDANYTSYK